MLRKTWDVKLARFMTVGVFNTLSDIAILNVLVFFAHITPVVANIMSASISMTISYFLNHRIVFRSKEKRTRKQFILFFAVTGFGIVVIQSAVIYGVSYLLGNEQAVVSSILGMLPFNHLTTDAFILNTAKVMAVLAATTWNFSIYHFIIFKTKSDKEDQD